MIIVTLKGGLGNQLFQYACGRALSLRNNDTLKLDVTGYEGAKNADTPREYSLARFNIVEHIAEEKEILPLKNPRGPISKFYRKVKTKFGFANIEFIPRILKLKGDAFLNGYWQTEKYFIDKETEIRKEFTLKQPLGRDSQRFADLIAEAKKTGTAVSLHVRRGDVARDAWKNPYYGITTPEYYERALKTLAEKMRAQGDARATKIFVFSDDMEWTRQNIRIPFETIYMETAGKNLPDHEELILMSRCDHHIIANSSFSWWGAWLNPNRSKIVIAPKQWIRKKQWQHKDICPPSWIRV